MPYKVIDIDGTEEFQTFLLSHNIGVGSVFQLKFTSKLYQLTTIDIDQKTLSIRNEDFNKIKWEIVQ